MRLLRILCVSVLLTGAINADERPSFLHSGTRIVFLGDSITAAGDYISIVEAQLRAVYGSDVPELINLGLPSETCTGLSEPEHPFPRPDVHERLDRALEKSSPDLVVACYGMNDGIYYPFSNERFAAYQSGVKKIIAKVKGAGADCLILTPPAFDPEPFRRQGKLLPIDAEKFAWLAIYEGYDLVIQHYANWILLDSELGVERINVHDPIRDFLRKARQTNPEFALSNDGVHMNREGHRLMAAKLLETWGVSLSAELPESLVDLCHQKNGVLHASWLSHVGHKRPGGKPGLPLKEAEEKAAAIDTSIAEMLHR